MTTSSTHCELVDATDHVVLVLRPGVSGASWAEIEAFGSDAHAALRQKTPPVCLVDLTAMTYIGSSTIALLVRVWKMVQSRQGKMVVVTAHLNVLEVIRLAGLDQVWTIEPSLELARKRLHVHQRNVGSSPSSMWMVVAICGAVCMIAGVLLAVVFMQFS